MTDLLTKTIQVSVKADEDGRITGYASRFGEMDQGGDVVAKGAFAATLAGERTVKMLWQHDPAQPIGVWDEATEDDTGLHVSGRILPEVAKGREALALVRAGAIDGLSIGYRTRKASRGGNGERILEDVDLWEVSLVTFPMLTSARVAKAAEEFERGNSALVKRMIEGNLREAGFSVSEAKAAAAAAARKLADMREAVTGLDEFARWLRENTEHGKE